MTKKVKSHTIVPDVVTQIANLVLIVLLETQNASNAKRSATMQVFALQEKAVLKSQRKARWEEVEAVRLLQVQFEVDVFEFQVLTALQLRRGDRVCEPIAFKGWMLSL